MLQRATRHLVFVGLVCALLGLGHRSLGAGNGQATALRAPASRQTRLEAFLRRYIGPRDSDDNRSTLYQSAFVDLRGDGARDVIVYLMGREWCGSGGCTTMVLSPVGPSYRVVTYMTITSPPIIVLTTKSHGWHDIAVWVQGGGIQPGYEALLPYNGKTYPSNPTVPPARSIRKKHPGKVVIPTVALKAGKRLYP